MAKALFLVGMGLLSLLLGAFTAFAPELSARVAVLAVLGLALVFAAIQRDTGAVSPRFGRAYVAALLLIAVFWPTYIILKVKGLPALDPRRLFALFSVCLLLYMLVARGVVRSRLAGLHGIGLFLMLCLVGMALWRLITAFIAPYPILALPAWFWEVAGDSAVTVVALLVIRQPDLLGWVARLILWISVPCALLAVAETVTGRTLVIDALGRFANVDELTATALSLSRVRDGGLRAQGPFEHPLPLTEFGCVAFAIAAASLLWPRVVSGPSRALSWLGMGSALACIGLSGSRSGMVCLVVAVAWLAIVKLMAPRAGVRLSGFEAALRLTVVAATLLGLAVAAVPVVADLAKGHSQAQSESSASRVIMLQKGQAAIADAPLMGAGVGMGVTVAGIRGRGGVPTLDNYLLLVAVESGLPYALAFMLLFALPAVWAGQRVLMGGHAQPGLLAGASAALLALLVMRSVLSINYNLPIAFLLLGLIAIQQAPKPRLAAPLVGRRGSP